jgi:hypothetical protein
MRGALSLAMFRVGNAGYHQLLQNCASASFAKNTYGLAG